MGARFHSWWQKRRKLLLVTGLIALLVAVIVLIWASYAYKWGGAGFVHKTVWDWLQLLIVPLVLAVVAILFQRANTHTEQQIALDKQHEDLLQAYLDRISELLLKESLRTSPSEEVRNVARVRTITVLTQLDARRIGYVFTFLREAGLMSTTSNSSAVSLQDADLSKVNWSKANLFAANLFGANLTGANLSEADLGGANLYEANLIRANLGGADLTSADLREASLGEANLSGANLTDADLSEAYLIRANLSGANLTDAEVTEEQLKAAKSLKGATMPDGSIHP